MFQMFRRLRQCLSTPSRRTGRASAHTRCKTRLTLEALEDRLAPALILWDGGPTGTGTDWHTAANWVGDVLPGPDDDAQIGSAFSAVTITSASDVDIRSVTSAARLQITNGLFSVAAPSTINNSLTLIGGELAGTGNLSVSSGQFSWSGGTMSGSGQTVIAAGVAGTVSGTGDKFLGRTLANSGNTTYSGTNLYFGPTEDSVGRITNSGTFTASGDGDFLEFFSGAHGFINNGTFFRSGPGTTTFTGVAFSNGTFSNVRIVTGTLQLNGQFSNFNSATSTLTGGRYFVQGTFQFTDANIVTNAAYVSLETPSATIVDQSGVDALANFATNLASGNFFITRNFATTDNFTNNGFLQVDNSSTFTVTGNLTNFNSATNTLTGGGYSIGSNSAFRFTGANIVNNAATISLTGASAAITDQTGANALASFATNLAGGNFTIQSARNFTTAGNFTNNGSLQVFSASTFTVSGNLTNFNSATRTLTGGSYTIFDSGSGLRFPGADIVNNAASINLAGASAAITDQTGANALANFASNLAGASFVIQSARNFTTAGNFTNNGFLDILNSSTFTVTANFTNNDFLGVFSSSTFTVNGNLTNFNSATRTLTGGSYTIFDSTLRFTGADIVNNAANINLAGASAAITDQTGANALANFATNLAGASFIIQSARNFTTAGNFVNNGSVQVFGASTFTVTANLTNNGTLNVGQSNSTLSVTANVTNFNSATNTLSGGSYFVSGTFRFTGANIVNNAATLSLTGALAAITNETGGDALATFATNLVGGNFTLTNRTLTSSAGSFSNAGNLTINTNATLATTAPLFTNSGNLTIGTNATLIVPGTYRQTAGTTALPAGSSNMGIIIADVELLGGVLSGSGIIMGNVTNSGTITVGGAGAAGILYITGNYTQTASGVLNLEVGGLDPISRYDILMVEGTSSLAGTLNTTRIGGYVPNPDDIFFAIRSGGTRSGTFSTITGLIITSSLAFEPSYFDNGLLLSTIVT